MSLPTRTALAKLTSPFFNDEGISPRPSIEPGGRFRRSRQRDRMPITILKSILHNIGVVLVGLGLMSLCTGVDRILGWPAFSFPLIKFAAIALMVLGFLTRVWATTHFYSHKMRVISFEPQATLITSGPYRF